MMVRVPWKPHAMGKRTSAMVEHVDLYPSIAEAVGVPVDVSVESVDGASWVGLLDDPSGKGHKKDVAYSQFPRCWPKLNPTHTPADYDRTNCDIYAISPDFFYWKCINIGELPLKNDDFVLKCDHLF